MALTSITTEFSQNKIQFMDRYPCLPPKNLPGVDTYLQRNVNAEETNWNVCRVTTPYSSAGFYRNKYDCVITHDGQSREAGNRAAALAPLGRPGERKIRFLPYISGMVAKYAIFNTGTAHTFFTGGINGCSVFIDGTHRRPVVYHVGQEGSLATVFSNRKDYGLGPNLMQRLNRNYEDKKSISFYENLVHHYNGWPCVTQVNKRHYISSGHPKGSTQRSRDLAAWLATSDMLGFKIPPNKILVNPYGCVWGQQVGLNWEFYLQENALIILMGKMRRGVGVVMRHSKIFPTPRVILRASPDHGRLKIRIRLVVRGG